MLGKMAELIETVISWGLRTLLGVAAGTAGGAWSCSSGNGFSEAECCGKNCRCSSWDRGARLNAVTELVLTTAVLVRNSLGIALLLVILAVGRDHWSDMDFCH